MALMSKIIIIHLDRWFPNVKSRYDMMTRLFKP